MAYRVDIGTLSAPRRLKDGRLVADAHLTRAGIFPYQNPDGSTRLELRHPDEVFKPESIASANLLPFTNNHPDNRVDGSNARDHMVGSTGEKARRDGNRIANTVMVADGATVKDIEDGKTQVSCGYHAGYDPTPGTYKGERYDGRQTNIIYNHVALVEVGRAGSDIRIRMDKADAAIMIERQDGAEASTMDELKEALLKVAELQVKVTASETATREATERADKAEAERDTAKDELKTNTESAKTRADKADADFEGRVTLRMDAKPILGDEYKCADSDKAIRLALITKVFNQDAKEKSDGYIEARAELAVEAANKSGSALDAVRVAATGTTPVVMDGEGEEAAAIKRMHARQEKLAKGSE